MQFLLCYCVGKHAASVKRNITSKVVNLTKEWVFTFYNASCDSVCYTKCYIEHYTRFNSAYVIVLSNYDRYITSMYNLTSVYPHFDRYITCM